MISDRSYMRDSYGRQSTSALTWLICALIAGFIVQSIFHIWLNVDAFQAAGALSRTNIERGWVWTFASYAFLHGGPLHLAFNCLFLFLVGRELQPLLGDKRLIWLSLAAAIGGGAFWVATTYARGGSGVLVGASAIVMAYIVVFACIFPQWQRTFLLFFVIPVTIRSIWAVTILAAGELIGFLALELPGRPGNMVAHSAHLGGMAVGWLYFRFVHQREWRNPDVPTEIAIPKWFKKSRKAETTAPVYKVNLAGSEDLKVAVDRILDKINSEGFGALTDEEKRLLDRAKDSLSRR